MTSFRDCLYYGLYQDGFQACSYALHSRIQWGNPVEILNRCYFFKLLQIPLSEVVFLHWIIKKKNSCCCFSTVLKAEKHFSNLPACNTSVITSFPYFLSLSPLLPPVFPYLLSTYLIGVQRNNIFLPVLLSYN